MTLRSEFRNGWILIAVFTWIRHLKMTTYMRNYQPLVAIEITRSNTPHMGFIRHDVLHAKMRPFKNSLQTRRKESLEKYVSVRMAWSWQMRVHRWTIFGNRSKRLLNVVSPSSKIVILVKTGGFCENGRVECMSVGIYTYYSIKGKHRSIANHHSLVLSCKENKPPHSRKQNEQGT